MACQARRWKLPELVVVRIERDRVGLLELGGSDPRVLQASLANSVTVQVRRQGIVHLVEQRTIFVTHVRLQIRHFFFVIRRQISKERLKLLQSNDRRHAPGTACLLCPYNN